MLAGLVPRSAGLAGLALPGLSTFVSEFLVLVGTFTRYEVAAALATAGIILAAIYILWMYQRTMTGPVSDDVAGMGDLKARELWAVGPLIALIVVLGVYPKPVLDIINPAVHQHAGAGALHRSGPAASRPGSPAAHQPEQQGPSPHALDRASRRDRTRGGARRSPRRTSSTASSRRCCWSSAPAVAGVLVEAFAPRALRRGHAPGARRWAAWPARSC